MPKVSIDRAAAYAPADDIALEDIIFLEAFHKQHPNIANEARLRWWIFHRKSNGLESSGAIIKRAGRWFVVVPRIKAWLLADSARAA